MKNLARSTFIGAALLASSAAMVPATAADLSAVPSGAYVLDPTHGFITFSFNHLGLSDPTLSFDDFTVDLNLDSENPTKSIVTVNIDPTSILPGSAIFKEHLSGTDWFDMSKYPQITFQSTTITAEEDGTYILNGDLTVKGQTKPLSLKVTINAAKDHPMTGKPVIGLSATGELLRSDFGMGAFAPNVSDEIKLNISAEMTKVQ